MRQILAALTLLALCASGVYSQTVVQDGSVSGTNKKGLGGTIVSGMSRSDSVIRVLTQDANGNLLIKEQSPVNSTWALRNFGISSTSIAVRGSKIGSPIQYNDASAGNLQFTLAVADSADTSCAFLIYLYGKQSSVAGDGLDFQIPARWTGTSGTYSYPVALPDSVLQASQPSGWFIGPDNGAVRNPYYKGDLTLNAVKVPGTAYIQTTRYLGTGASGPLGPIGMARTMQFQVPIPSWVRAQYLNVVVFNLSVSAAHAITVDCIVHGN